MTITFGIGGYILSVIMSYILQRIMLRLDEEFMVQGAFAHLLFLFIPVLNVGLYVIFLFAIFADKYIFPFVDKHTSWAERLYKPRRNK